MGSTVCVMSLVFLLSSVVFMIDSSKYQYIKYSKQGRQVPAQILLCRLGCVSILYILRKGSFIVQTNATSEDQWASSSCAIDSLYVAELMSETVPVIIDNRKIM